MKKGKATLASHLLNAATIAATAYFLYTRLPGILRQYQAEGAPAAAFRIQLTSGDWLDLAQDPQPRVLVFWATWCAPCKVELARLQRLVDKQDLAPTQILAISSYEDPAVVAAATAARGYTFTSGVDPHGRISRLYQVETTPTVVLRTSEGRAAWISSGLSPTLELRVRDFCRPTTY